MNTVGTLQAGLELDVTDFVAKLTEAEAKATAYEKSIVKRLAVESGNDPTKARSIDTTAKVFSSNTPGAHKRAIEEAAQADRWKKIDAELAALERDTTTFVRTLDKEAVAHERTGRAAAAANRLKREDITRLTAASGRMQSFAMGAMMTGAGAGDEAHPLMGATKMAGMGLMASGNPYAMGAGAALSMSVSVWEQINRQEQEAAERLRAVQGEAGKAARALREAKFGPDDMLERMGRAVEKLREMERAATSYTSALDRSIALTREAQNRQQAANQATGLARIEAAEALMRATLRPGDDRGAETIRFRAAQERIALERAGREEELQAAQTRRLDELTVAEDTARRAAQVAAAVAGAESPLLAKRDAASRDLEALKGRLERQGIGYMDSPEYATKAGNLAVLDQQAAESKKIVADAAARQADAENRVLAIRSAIKDQDTADAAERRAAAAKEEADTAAETLRHKEALRGMSGTWQVPVDSMARAGLFVQGQGAQVSDRNAEIAQNTRESAATLSRIEAALKTPASPVWQN
jgi:hypothetical protein